MNITKKVNVFLKDNSVFLFFCCYFIFNIIFLSNSLSISHDSIGYFKEITNNELTLHPHHLYFIPLSSLLHKLFSSLFFLNEVEAAGFINLMFGMMSLFIIYKYTRNILNFAKNEAQLTLMLIAFSFAFWFYNLNIETYHIPLTFILLTVYIISLKDNMKHIILAAIIGGIAVLFHQLHALIGVVIVIYLLSNGIKKNIKKVLYFSIVFNLVWILGYWAAVIILDISSVDDLIYWFFKYHHEVNSWTGLSAAIIIKPLIGIYRSFITSHGFLTSDPVSQIMSNQFDNKNLMDDSFLVRNISEYEFIYYIILAAIFFITYFISMYFGVRHYRKIFSSKYKLIVIFLIIYSLFFCFWDAANLEFWIPQSILINILIAKIILHKFPKHSNKVIISLIGILFLINFRFTILNTSSQKNDYFHQKTENLNEFSNNSNTIIIGDGDWIFKDYVKLYSENKYMELTEFNKLSNKERQRVQTIFAPEPLIPRLDVPKFISKDTIHTNYEKYLFLDNQFN